MKLDGSEILETSVGLSLWAAMYASCIGQPVVESMKWGAVLGGLSRMLHQIGKQYPLIRNHLPNHPEVYLVVPVGVAKYSGKLPSQMDAFLLIYCAISSIKSLAEEHFSKKDILPRIDLHELLRHIFTVENPPN